MKKNIITLVVCALALGYTAFAQASSDIRKVDFLNANYTTSACTGSPTTIKLTAGKLSSSDGMLYEVRKDELAYGDITYDGIEDAVVMIRCAANTLRGFEIFLFTSDNGKPRMITHFTSDDVAKDYQKFRPNGTLQYAGENGPFIVDESIAVEALTDGSFAAPAYTTIFAYKFAKGGFTLDGKPALKKR